MNRYISLLLFGILPCLLQAQSFNCDDDQYLLPEFTVDETPGILFGNNTGVNGQSEDLLLDIYEPSGDTSAVRPVILWGFGGSFVGGSRGQVDFLCEDYAALGYVAVAYDYRIGFFIPSSISTALAVLRGAHDTRAAVRWLYKS
ncbi:MAG: carboxylesterase family protein, partial [Bacteroidota bacterium]|nr:carboxylesterase family protein [Bacteroidota bacterium]